MTFFRQKKEKRKTQTAAKIICYWRMDGQIN